MDNEYQKLLDKIEEIKGQKGGKGATGGAAGRIAIEYPNTLQSRATARVLDSLVAGPIVGLARGYQSIKLDDTPMGNADGTLNFQGIGLDMRTGLHIQSHMPGFPAVESAMAVGVQAKYGVPVVRSISDPDCNAVRTTVRIPALYRQDKTTGDVMPYFVGYYWEIATDGGPFVLAATDVLNDKCMSAYERDYLLPLPPGQRWDIRFTRVSPDSTSSADNNDTWWSSYTRIIEAKMAYPDTAYMGITVDSALFGTSIPQRTYELDMRYIKVPMNYNPVTRAYSGFFNNTFKLAYSNNPAWVLFDLLTDPVNGLGRELLTPSGGYDRIDTMELYNIARYCDELVPNGLGGLEPRFTFNGLLNVQEDALNVIAAVAGMMRCLVYFAAGTIYFSQDRPMNYKRIISPANTINGIFNYEGTSKTSRHSVALVSYLNPNDDYKADIEPVEDADSIAELGWKPLQDIALGCTSRGQAYRQGMMALDAEKHCKKTATFSTGLDCADIRPGEVVALADPSIAGVRSGGRIKRITKTSITFDSAYPFDPNELYFVTMTMQDSTLYTEALWNPGTSSDTATFNTPIERLPAKGAVYNILASNLAPQLFRIMGVAEGEGITFNFTGLQYDPAKYIRVEYGIDLPQTPTTILPTGVLPPPTNLSYVDFIYLKTGLTPTAAITLSWSYTDPRATAFEIEYQPPGQSGFVGKVVINALSVDIDVQSQGTYVFRVRAIDGLGRHSVWATITVASQALFKPPADVQNFRGEVYSEFLLLTWDAITDYHLDHYELRYTAEVGAAVVWETAQVVQSSIGKSVINLSVPLQVGTYMLKAVSSKDVYSTKPAVIYNGISVDFTRLNVVIENNQNPNWPGKRQYVIQTPEKTLELFEQHGVYEHLGYYYFSPSYFDLGGIYTSRLTPVIRAYGRGINDNIFSLPNIFEPENIFNVSASSEWNAYLEYSLTNEDPSSGEEENIFALANIFEPLNIFGTTMTWGPWIKFVNPINIQSRSCRIRLVMQSLDGYATPVVLSAGVILDMPDRLIDANDFTVPAEGYYFQFVPPFKATPAISPPLIQMGTVGDRYEISEKSRAGFRLKLFDVNGVPASRMVDWIAKGYGAEIA